MLIGSASESDSDRQENVTLIQHPRAALNHVPLASAKNLQNEFPSNDPLVCRLYVYKKGHPLLLDQKHVLSISSSAFFYGFLFYYCEAQVVSSVLEASQ